MTGSGRFFALARVRFGTLMPLRVGASIPLLCTESPGARQMGRRNIGFLWRAGPGLTRLDTRLGEVPNKVGWCHLNCDKCRPVPRQLRLAAAVVSFVVPNPLNYGLPWDTPFDSLQQGGLK